MLSLMCHRQFDGNVKHSNQVSEKDESPVTETGVINIMFVEPRVGNGRRIVVRRVQCSEFSR
jgi:hypothetical protein